MKNNIKKLVICMSISCIVLSTALSYNYLLNKQPKSMAQEVNNVCNELVDDIDSIREISPELAMSSNPYDYIKNNENYDKLVARMKQMGIETDPLYWYLELRKYGTNIHSGFGLGFERLLMYITGIENIRDVIPYPRTPGNCEF